jgi:hypothetical protein
VVEAKYRDEAMADINSVYQLIGTALGGALSIAGGFLAQWMTTGREREGRRIDAEENRKRQRAEFQVKTLLEVQEVAWKILDAGLATLALSSRMPGMPQSPQRVQTQMEHFESWKNAVTRQIILTARVDDSQVRELLTRLRSQANDIMRLSSTADSNAASQNLRDTFESVNDRIGTLLRELT